MLFYKIRVTLKDQEEEDLPRSKERIQRHKIYVKEGEFNALQKEKAHFIISAKEEGEMTIVSACGKSVPCQKEVRDFLKFMGVEYEQLLFDEITYMEYCNNISSADRSGFIEDEDDTLGELGLVNYHCRNFDFSCSDNLIKKRTKKEVLAKAKVLLAEDTLLPELGRIYAPHTENACGHPVHYLVECSNRDTRRELYQLLLAALYKAGRVRSQRYVFMDIYPDHEVNPQALHDIYKAAIDSTVVIRYMTNCEEDGDIASAELRNIQVICRTMMQFRNDVLTVLCLPMNRETTKEHFAYNLGSMLLVNVVEDQADYARARKYLTYMAKTHNIKADQHLYEPLNKNDTYLPDQLHVIYDEWYYKTNLETNYPEYAGLASQKELVAKEKVKGNAYQELNDLIGLTKAKQVINQALDFAKAQKLFAGMGMNTTGISRHMVFTGNPGSAKTTVARLYAQIMKDNHVLSNGHLVEVGRSDLVGKYVGHTAPLVKKRFEQAMGGVLFIDEAYSLTDDRNGSYGDEAINTIVQEMENHRKDVVVVFAGYPEPMKKFLDKNPGLRSRIGFHISFEDYNAEELLAIAELMAEKANLKLSDGAKDKLLQAFAGVTGTDDFGNGRYVRNMIERARIEQASRLVHMDVNAVTAEDVTTILDVDIVVPEKATKESKIIGFSA